MKCDYCGRGIRSGEEGEQEVRVTVSGGRKTRSSNGMVFEEYHCCSYECRMKMFDRMINAVYEEKLQREEIEEADDSVEKTKKELTEIRKLNKKNKKTKLSSGRSFTDSAGN